MVSLIKGGKSSELCLSSAHFTHREETRWRWKRCQEHFKLQSFKTKSFSIYKWNISPFFKGQNLLVSSICNQLQIHHVTQPLHPNEIYKPEVNMNCEHFPRHSYIICFSIWTLPRPTFIFLMNIIMPIYNSSFLSIRQKSTIIQKHTEQRFFKNIVRQPVQKSTFPKEAWPSHDVRDREGRRDGGREEGRRKIWQIHKAFWLHCGHVAASTTTEWPESNSELTSAESPPDIQTQWRFPVFSWTQWRIRTVEI